MSPLVNYVNQNFVTAFIYNRKPVDRVVFLSLADAVCV